MGNKLGITEGAWRHYDDTTSAGKTGRHEIVAVGKTVAQIYATNGCELEDKANARLVAEAGTVANETGLTPRQLKEQRDELLQVLKNVSNELNTIDNGVHPKIEMALAMADAGIARAAIARVKEGK